MAIHPHDKAHLRALAKKIEDQLSPEQRQAADAALTARLFSLPEFAQAQALFCYVSRGREIDTRPILQAALAARKRVAVPRCTGPGQMEARLITSLDALSPGAFGILEPAPDAPLLSPEEMDLALVPCVACDTQGVRLGHGGGYYDRYLPRVQGLSLCLCREALLFAHLPEEATDVRPGLILTEKRLLRFF